MLKMFYLYYSLGLHNFTLYIYSMKKETQLTVEEVQYSTSLNTINWGKQFKHFTTKKRVIKTLPIKNPGTDVFIFTE